MASSRFIKDSGLTARMTLTMFLLGGLFVGLVVVLIQVVGSGYAPIVAVIAIGMAFWQWWSSDKVAMRAMRAREVTPEEAPELHGMIDRLCALADMPKPRVGVSDLPVANAFATGALSKPHDRYQARVAWLLLLPPLLYAARRETSSGLMRTNAS